MQLPGASKEQTESNSPPTMCTFCVTDACSLADSSANPIACDGSWQKPGSNATVYMRTLLMIIKNRGSRINQLPVRDNRMKRTIRMDISKQLFLWLVCLRDFSGRLLPPGPSLNTSKKNENFPGGLAPPRPPLNATKSGGSGRPSGWAIRMDHPDQASGWAIQMGHPDGPSGWAIRIGIASGWTIRMGHPDWRSGWAIRIDYLDGPCSIRMGHPDGLSGLVIRMGYPDEPAVFCMFEVRALRFLHKRSFFGVIRMGHLDGSSG